MEIATKPNETLRADEIRPLTDAEIDQVDGAAAGAIFWAAVAFGVAYVIGKYC
jgi:hypothetical protein